MEKEVLFEEGEVVLEKARKHFLVYLMDLLSHIFGCAVFIVGAQIISSRFGMFGSYTGYVLIFFVIIFWLSFFYAWTKNYFDVWYITNKHVVAVNQKELLEREEAFMELRRIQDVFFQKDGILQTWFNYGKLRIQSAGTEQEFVLENVHDVEKIAHTLMELRDKAKNGDFEVV